MNLVFQGIIEFPAGTQIKCDYENMIISLIVINHIPSDNYVLEVYRTDIAADNERLLYKFNLTDGDSVRDVTQYKLAKGDYFTLKSSQSNTTYYISAEVS
jgi:hypothetical protein